MKTASHAKTLTLVQIALLSALVVVLQLFFSAVRVGAVTLNFVLVPIVIAGVFISPTAAFFIGMLAGITTFVQVFTSGDIFYVFLMTHNPVATACICILKTALAGLIAGIVCKISKLRMLNVILSSILCPIINTGLFVLGMYLFFGNAFTADATFGPMVTGSILSFILVVLVGANFFIELLLNVIVCPLLSKALLSTKMFKNK